MNVIYNQITNNSYLTRLYNNHINDSDFDYDINSKTNLSGNLLDIPEKIYVQDFWENVEQRNNKTRNIGYDYRNKILKKSLSGFFYLEYKRESILNKMEYVFTWMVEQIKFIKKQYNYILPKNYRNFN